MSSDPSHSAHASHHSLLPKRRHPPNPRHPSLLPPLARSLLGRSSGSADIIGSDECKKPLPGSERAHRRTGASSIAIAAHQRPSCYTARHMAADETTLESLAKLITTNAASADTKFAALAQDITDFKTEMMDQFDHVDEQFRHVDSRLGDTGSELAAIRRSLEQLEDQAHALALFGRRPLQPVVSLVIRASKTLHRSRLNAAQQEGASVAVGTCVSSHAPRSRVGSRRGPGFE
jgi:hypothetical protein